MGKDGRLPASFRAAGSRAALEMGNLYIVQKVAYSRP